MDYRIRWMTYKGKKILVNDYHGMEGKKLLSQIDMCVLFIIKSKEKEISLLVNVEHVEVSKASQLKFAEAARHIKKYCKKTAVIGLTPTKRKIVNAINAITGLGAKGFKTDLEAKNWLISDTTESNA